MCVCMCVCMYVCIHICVCMCLFMCVYMCVSSIYIYKVYMAHTLSLYTLCDAVCTQSVRVCNTIYKNKYIYIYNT